jgi:hypothetical protein
VYAAPVDNEEALHRRTVDACQTIRNYPRISARMRRPVMRRGEVCIESHGGHFEHLSQMYHFSCNSQIECIRTHVDMEFFLFWYVELLHEVRILQFTLYSQLPNCESHWLNVVRDFNDRWNFLLSLDAIAGKHMNIKC